jgi:hypothetical protein
MSALLALMGIGGAPLAGQDTPNTATMTRTVPATGYRDETHWLTDEVVQEMVRWTGRAGGIAKARAIPTNDDGTAYRIDGATCDIRIAHHIWSADDYLATAKALLPQTAAKATTPADDDGSALARALLTPTTTVMWEQDDALSQQVKKTPLDPLLQEKAALLCATMAFRESAGRFCDARRELCAATAHLALAQAQRPQPGPCARIAAAIIEALAGREESALAAPLPTDPNLAGWKRAVALRATSDWKKYQITASDSMVEQLAYLRALVEHQGDGVAATWLEKMTPQESPDWGRLMCEGNLSVGNGHVFAHAGLGDEFKALDELWTYVRHRAITPDLLPEALTLTDAADATPRVLSIARWSAFLDRHRANRLVTAHVFIYQKWGVPERAEQLRSICADKLAADPLIWMVRMQFKPDPRHDYCAMQVTTAARRDPSLLTAWMWNYIRSEGDLFEASQHLPKARDWWYRITPPGTAYHAGIRSMLLDSAQPELQAVSRLNPHNTRLKSLIAQRARKTDFTSLSAAYGDLVDLDATLAYEIMQKAPAGAEKIRACRRLVAMDPQWNLQLAQLLIQAHQDQDAAAAYEAAYTNGTNRVQIANSMGWLVTWYADHGNMARAREIANAGYKVFSYVGIDIKARLDERTGDLDGAEHAYKDILERYEDELPLLAFWQRTATQRPASKSGLDGRIRQAFPLGQHTVTMESFKAPPQSGIRIASESPLSLQHGIHRDNIVVALDGIRCETQNQYILVRSLKTDVPLDLIVWNGTTYRHVVADVPDRRLQVNLDDWTATSGGGERF